MLVQPNSGVTNVNEFVEYAKKTGKVNMGSFAIGSTPHMVASELNQQHGLSIETIHYRGEAPMWTDVMSGANSESPGGSVKPFEFTPPAAAVKTSATTTRATPSSREPEAPILTGILTSLLARNLGRALRFSDV